MGMPQKIQCEVKKVIDHGDHVYTLELEPERPVPSFIAGQFMHLAIDPYEPGDFWPESRVFSIQNSPTLREKISFTYSVVGSFTKKMEQFLKIGSRVWIKLPYGEFFIKGDHDIVLIAGGTGVTAFTAFIEQINPTDNQAVTIFYGARTRDLLIFLPLIEQKVKENNLFSAYYFVEESNGIEDERLYSGRLSIQSIFEKIDNPLNCDYFLSGPPLMLKVFSQDLEAHNILPEQIKTDAWA